jgi:hypothetical protein
MLLLLPLLAHHAFLLYSFGHSHLVPNDRFPLSMDVDLPRRSVFFPLDVAVRCGAVRWGVSSRPAQSELIKRRILKDDPWNPYADGSGSGSGSSGGGGRERRKSTLSELLARRPKLEDLLRRHVIKSIEEEGSKFCPARVSDSLPFFVLGANWCRKRGETVEIASKKSCTWGSSALFSLFISWGASSCRAARLSTLPCAGDLEKEQRGLLKSRLVAFLRKRPTSDALEHKGILFPSPETVRERDAQKQRDEEAARVRREEEARDKQRRIAKLAAQVMARPNIATLVARSVILAWFCLSVKFWLGPVRMSVTSLFRLFPKAPRFGLRVRN